MEWTCGSFTIKRTGEAVWKTPSQPSTTESKELSSKRSALKSCNLSLAPSSLSKWSTFLGLPAFAPIKPIIHKGNQIAESLKHKGQECWWIYIKRKKLKVKDALTWVTNSGSDSVTTLKEKLNNPWSNKTSSTCHTHHFSFPTHNPFSLIPSKFWTALELLRPLLGK